MPFMPHTSCSPPRATPTSNTHTPDSSIPVTGSSSLGPGEQIALSHWLSGGGGAVTCARISAAAQLVGLGLASGEVALYRLWGSVGMEPLRTISLGDWGYEPEVTGSVSDLQWSPDGRALAVNLFALLPPPPPPLFAAASLPFVSMGLLPE